LPVSIHASPIWFLLALLPLICGIGLMFDRAWARYLWYAIASVASIGAIVVTVSMMLHRWRINGAVDAAIALIPGMLLLSVCVGGSLAVRHRARTRRYTQ
jgi:bacteriorhodopsin